MTIIVTDGVVAFELDFQFAKSKLKNDYPVCSIKRCIHPFKEGEFQGVVTDGVVAFELDFQFAKSKFKSDYPVCSIKRCIHPFTEGELA